MKKHLLIIATCLGLFMGGCATHSTWTTEQQNSIKSLQVVLPMYSEDSYSKPSAKDANLFEKSGAQGGMGFIFMVIDGITGAVQQGKYDANNESNYSVLQSQVEQNSTNQFLNTLETTIKSVPFFTNKISSTGTTNLKITIDRHGFFRTSDTTVKDMKMFYGLKGQVVILASDGNELLKKSIIAKSSTSASMSELVANDGKLIKQLMNEAQQSFSDLVRLQLILKTANK